MANTGFEISQNVAQHFTTGPDSGSKVTGSFDQNLSVAPFSASLNGEEFFNRSYNPVTCEPGFEDCLVPLLTSLTTGSRRGRFIVNYVTQSSFNTPIDITASISDDQNFDSSRTEIVSSSIGTLFPITSSFISGTLYFRAFTSCSGPTPSPNSDLLSFTYDLIPPLSKSVVEVIFTNTLSSPMEVEIRSERGNQNYTIAARESITYDYTNNSYDPGAWVSNNKSVPLNVTIKGGSKSTYGNSIQRVTNGIIKETYTTGGGFNGSNNRRDTSANYNPDTGINFQIQQLVLPEGDTTTTTFSLVQNTPPPPAPSVPTPPYTPYPRSVVGSVPLETEEKVCANSGVNFREKTYQKFKGYLYDNLEDALIDNKTNYSFNTNYILTTLTTYIIVNKEGKIESEGNVCVLPNLTLYTVRGAYISQEDACKRSKNSTGSTTYSYKDNTLIGTNLSGRYPILEQDGGRGGRNVILSSGKIIGYETCGTELTDVTYGAIGFTSTYINPEDTSNNNPSLLRFACNYNVFETYSLGPSGTIYYGINYKEGKYKYIPIGGSAGRFYKDTSNIWYKIQTGIIVETISTNPC
jgi:hypothetical protein